MTIYAHPGTTGSIVELKSRYANFIGGDWVNPVKGDYAEDLAPATGLPIAEYARSTSEDIDNAIAAAKGAFPGWARTSTTDRAAVLNAIADRLEAHKEQIAVMESWENGKPVRETLAADIPLAIDHFRYFAAAIRTQQGTINKLSNELVSYHFYEPIGVVAQIIPWNFPILMAAWKLAPALAAGNTVVLKPASATPISILYVMELIADLLPAGTLNVVNGPGASLGQHLVEHEDIGKVAFTGSTATGRQIMQYATKNIIPSTMELGGKSPNLFFADVSRHKDDYYRKAIEGFTMFALNKGEICSCPSRALLQESLITDGFLDDAVARSQGHQAGRPPRHGDRDGPTEQRRSAREDLRLPQARPGRGLPRPSRRSSGRFTRRARRRLLHRADRLPGHQRHAGVPGGDLRPGGDRRIVQGLSRSNLYRERLDLRTRVRRLEP